MSAPRTRFARSPDGGHIAYQVMGEGPHDLVVIAGPASHLDLQWEDPGWVLGCQRLASFARVVHFDRRGTGLSDPVAGPLTLEQQMDDLDAVLEAVGMRRVALFGAVEAGLCAMYAASHPDRITALVLANVAAGGAVSLPGGRRNEVLELIEEHWGEGRFISFFAPGRMGDARFADWWTRFERSSVSPSMAREVVELNARVDLSGVLPAIRVPTLVLHQQGNPLIPVQAGREVAALIPGARFVLGGGTDIYNWPGPGDPEMDVVEEFLTGRPPTHEAERVLATVLFTDIVASTGHAARLGDHAWRQLLDRHDAIVRDCLGRFRGQEVKTVGDGFLATFDGPARAVRCAAEIVEGVGPLGLQVRCGLHTGECAMLNDDISGLAVHIGARVAAQAGAGEVLVSSTVKDLIAGSELDFDDRGAQRLRGVPGEWRLYALRGAPARP